MTPSGGYCGDGCDDSFVDHDHTPPKTRAFRTSPLGQILSPPVLPTAFEAFAYVIIFCILFVLYKLFELETLGYFRSYTKNVDVDLRRPLPNQVEVFRVQDKKSHRNAIYSESMFLRKQGQVASNRFSSSPDPDVTPTAPFGPSDAPKWNSARTFGIQDENDSYGYGTFGGNNNYRSQSPCIQFGFDRRIAPGPMRYQTTTRPSVGTVPPPPKKGATRGQFGGNNQSQTKLYSNSRNDNNAQNTVPKSPFGFQNTSQKLPLSSFQNTSQKLPPSRFSRNNLGQLPACESSGPRSGLNPMFRGRSQLKWQPTIYNDKKQTSVSNNQRAPQIRNPWPAHALPLLALMYTKPSANVIGFPIPPRARA